MTSPLALVPRAHQVIKLIESLTNLTLPSAIRTLTRPGGSYGRWDRSLARPAAALGPASGPRYCALSRGRSC